jgi:acyl-CoA synthetase (AMP-forming)/AMP-acid ligase II
VTNIVNKYLFAYPALLFACVLSGCIPVPVPTYDSPANIEQGENGDIGSLYIMPIIDGFGEISNDRFSYLVSNSIRDNSNNIKYVDAAKFWRSTKLSLDGASIDDLLQSHINVQNAGLAVDYLLIVRGASETSDEKGGYFLLGAASLENETTIVDAILIDWNEQRLLINPISIDKTSDWVLGTIVGVHFFDASHANTMEGACNKLGEFIAEYIDTVSQSITANVVIIPAAYTTELQGINPYPRDYEGCHGTWSEIKQCAKEKHIRSPSGTIR